MVARHFKEPYQFCCLSDDATPIPGVKIIPINNQVYARPWWHKVHMFDPALGISGRILYFDLDVVIHDDICKLVSELTTEFVGVRDFNRKFVSSWAKLNSSVMSWIAGSHSEIFTKFVSDSASAMKLHGDQDWIYLCMGKVIKFWPDHLIQSYKWEIRSKQDINTSSLPRTFKTIACPEIPSNCSVCVFHGDPNPDKVLDPYVVDNWR
jgi:hypothetical protein